MSEEETGRIGRHSDKARDAVETHGYGREQAFGAEVQALESLAGRAYQALERLVVTLELEPGSVVTEQTLVSRTGMGRTPVREAVQRLAWEGLMEIRPRSGIAIATLEPRDFSLVLDAREGIEYVIARAAALHAAPIHTERMRRAESAMRDAALRGDMTAFLDADKAVDHLVGIAAGNPYAARLAAPLQTHSRRFWFRMRREGDLAASMEHHVAAIDAIVSHDADAAVAAAQKLMAHLRRVAG